MQVLLLHMVWEQVASRCPTAPNTWARVSQSQKFSLEPHSTSELRTQTLTGDSHLTPRFHTPFEFRQLSITRLAITSEKRRDSPEPLVNAHGLDTSEDHRATILKHVPQSVCV